MKHIGIMRKWSKQAGFTLTEVLLAVMIVGLISVALASLTRAAAREAGIGRSKIMLRNNLSLFVRTLRADMSQATRVDYLAGEAACNSSKGVALLQIAQNVDTDDNLILHNVTTDGASAVTQTAKYITYCFACGSDATNIVPSTATRGGKIYRVTRSSRYSAGDAACTMLNSSDLILDHVKYIPGSYYVPSFTADSFSRSWTNSLLSIKIITELNSTPVVNEVVEETFAMPMGY